MSPTDPIQELFDRAFLAVPAANSLSPDVLHRRLHRRNNLIRLTGLAGVALVVAIASTVLLSSSRSSNNVANAVTLYPRSSALVTSSQLKLDRNVLAARLRSSGYPDATVKISNGSLVVEGGPKNLANPTAMLTSSPELLIRKVLCFSGPLTKAATARPLPTRCSSAKYALTPTTLNSSGAEFATTSEMPDPALSAYATTSATSDRTHPQATALLPQGYHGTKRLLVGPTQLTLTPHAASGTVSKCYACGGWLVNVQLDQSDARIWDAVAKADFHLMLAVDLNGIVVESPLIEPDSSSFHSFDGSMQLLAPTKEGANALMAVLRSGPLAVALVPKTSDTAQHSSASKLPACDRSVVTVTLEKTIAITSGSMVSPYGTAHYATGSQVTGIRFSTRGPACHLLMGGPEVRFHFVSSSSLSFPVDVPSSMRKSIARNAPATLILVVVPVPAQSRNHCKARAATGPIIQGYAKGTGIGVTFARSFLGVCSSQKPGSITNFGVNWSGTEPT